MPNEEYQALFGASADDVRAALLEPFESADRRALEHAARRTPTTSSRSSATSAATTSPTSSTALRRARETTDRPTVIFAYTIKGYGLEIAGRPQNHSALLTGEQIESFRSEVGLTPETEWDGFAPDSPEAELLEAARERLDRGDAAAGGDVRGARVALRRATRPPRSRRRRRSAACCSSSPASRGSASGS